MNVKRRTKYIKRIGFIIGLLITILFVVTIIFNKQITNFLTFEVQSYGLVLIFLIIFILEFIPQYIGPHLITINSVALGFNINQVIIVAIISSTLGALLGFYVGKNHGAKLIRCCYKNKKEHEKNLLKKYGKLALIITAILPLPYIPMIFGSFNIRYRDFFFYGLIPRAVGMILITFLGGMFF